MVVKGNMQKSEKKTRTTKAPEGADVLGFGKL